MMPFLRKHTHTQAYRVNLFSQSECRVIVIRLEARLPVAWHVQHHNAPLLGQVLGHHHPHCLVGREAMKEEEGGRLPHATINVCLSHSSSLKVAVLNAVDSQKLSPQTSH